MGMALQKNLGPQKYLFNLVILPTTCESHNHVHCRLTTKLHFHEFFFFTVVKLSWLMFVNVLASCLKSIILTLPF